MVSAEKILVIDDDSTARLLMRTALQMTGFNALRATDGADALRQFVGDSLDMMRLDVKTPNVNGMEFCRALYAPEGPCLPCGMLKGRDDVRWVDAAAIAGSRYGLKIRLRP
jgi:DNA-binding response OmpR family regulator